MEKISLPTGVQLEAFSPVAYYDKHMDCIRVLTHDRSVTEHRLNEFFTVYEPNHRVEFDPEYVGFAIKGVHAMFAEIGMPIEGVHRLADLIDSIVKHAPGTAMSEMLKIIFISYKSTGDLKVDLQEAA